VKFLPRTIYDIEHEEFRRSFRHWLDTSIAPHHEEWERLGIGPRSIWLEAGQRGFLGLTVPEEFGGGGTDDYRFAAVMSEEIGATGLIGVPHGFTLTMTSCFHTSSSCATMSKKRDGSRKW
jgi:acyl-CoA dehydrogenase